jgi:REP element-mobilizing transposase RayT
MPGTRERLFDLTNPGWVHCISRCVRRAFLAGGRFAHRRGWVEDRLKALAGVFACEVGAYAVMSNHVHVVVRMDPEAALSWTALEVAERWCVLFGKMLPKGPDGRVEAGVVAGLAADAGWVAERRKRLGSLSWFMRALCEDIARRANAEDDCTGRFWEGRFTSVPLLDQAALIACMAYVDLNPVRAKIADRPERSAFTGVRERIRARQRHRIGQRAKALPAAERRTVLANAGLSAPPATAESGLWLAPVARCTVGDPPTRNRVTADDYLALVDATGRALRAGKRGAIPPELAPILARLDVSVEDWIATMTGWRSMLGGAIGHAASRTAEAARRGVDWVRNRCPLFAGRTTAA